MLYRHSLLTKLGGMNKSEVTEEEWWQITTLTEGYSAGSYPPTMRATADAHKPSDQIGFWLAVRRRAIDVKRCTDDEMHILTPFASLRVADANASTAMLPLMGLTNWRVRYIGSEMRTTKLLTNLSMIFIMFLTDGWLLGARSGHQDGGHSGGERAFAGGVREGPRGDTT
eukprot:5660718-Pyramimonas_sp.AAC.1